MPVLEFSTDQVKTMHKFLRNLSISTIETTKLNEGEQAHFWDVYAAFAGENDEIALDEQLNTNEAR